jgi:hypothetical protein
MKTIVHVNQHVIKENRKTGHKHPVLTCKTYKSNMYTNTAIIKLPDGTEVGRFVYRPEKPLPCGAHVWFETNLEITGG